MLATRSKLASGYGIASASPSSKRTSSPSAAARPRAAAIELLAMSTPVALAPRRAAISATWPEPQATSSTVVPGAISSRSTNSSAAGCMNLEK
jgi:hypothetical protein